MKKVTNITVQNPHQQTVLNEVNKIASKHAVTVTIAEEKENSFSTFVFEIEGVDSKEVYRTYNFINMYVEGVNFAERVSKTVDGKMTLKVGALHRTHVMSEIKNYAFNNGIKLTVEEDRGWLQSNYRLSVSGDYRKIKTFSNKILDFADRINED